MSFPQHLVFAANVGLAVMWIVDKQPAKAALAAFVAALAWGAPQ